MEDSAEDAVETPEVDAGEETYTIKFDVNGGTINSSYYFQDRSVTAGDSYYLSTGEYVATKDGYILDGWTVKGGSVVYKGSYTPTKSLTLYAHWATAYTIKFDVNGGTIASSYYFDDEKVAAGDTLYLSTGDSVATKDGCVLDGWTVKGGSVVNKGTYKPTKSLTLYAHWSTAYVIKFDVNGGTIESSYYFNEKKVAAGDTVYISAGDYVATKDGYIMDGWTVKGGSVVYKGDYKPTKSLTLYAHWVVAYTVKFDVNGGTIERSYYFEDRKVPEGEKVNLSTGTYVATKDGYILDGWTVKGGSVVYEDYYKPTKSLTLYAHWTQAYTVKFNVNGGTIVDEYDFRDRVVAKGDTIYLYTGDSTATKSGYALVGWTVKGGSAVYKGQYKPTKNITLYAKWAKTYKVTLNAGKGHFGTDKTATKKTLTIVTGTDAGEFINNSNNQPRYSTTVFIGWYKDAELKTPVKKSATITSNVTYYAKYQTKTYKITVKNLKGSDYENRLTGADVEKSTVDSYSFYVRQGYSIGSISAYKGGYKAQFFFDEACKSKPYYSSYVPTANMTVYAKWYAEVKVKWDGNGGKDDWDEWGDTSGEITSFKTLMCEELPDDMYREGYYFVGWYDVANPSKILPVSHVFTKSTTIKAKWAKGIKITFDPGAGKLKYYDQKVFYAKSGKKLGLQDIYPPTVEREGYNLKGWKSSTTGKLVSSIYDEKPTKATTYTAVWSKVSATTTVAVTLKGGAGSIYNYDKNKYVSTLVVNVPKNITYAQAEIEYFNNSHDDRSKRLSLAGWSKTSGGSILSASYKFTKDITLYPVWKQNTYLRIALVSNGGAIDGRPTNRPEVYSMLSKGDVLSLPTGSRIEREGYTFQGWFTDAACTKKVSSMTKYKVTASRYLYAKWKKN